MSYNFTSGALGVPYDELSEGTIDPSILTDFEDWENRNITLWTEERQNAGKRFSLYVSCQVEVEEDQWQKAVSAVSDPFQIEFFIKPYQPRNEKPVLVGHKEFEFTITAVKDF